jgi:hemerythrin-like domain-containing protein
MLPIAPLMIEHRIIERMIGIIKNELEVIERTNQINPVFIDTAVDFIRTYADKVHHGKEEDILFRELEKKSLSPEHKTILNELNEEHKVSRAAVKAVVEAKLKYLAGDVSQIPTIKEKLAFLVGFYPVHIEKEDKRFFGPVMNYFNPAEQQAMLEEGQIYDRKMIHRKYDAVVSDIEKARNLPEPKRSSNWLDFF